MPITWLNNEFVVQLFNGQCIIVLRSKMHETQRGVEVFVKGIPRNFGPNELVPVFSCAGLIHSIRLLMGYGQRNRGYAYVSYVNPSGLTRALQLFHGMHITVNHHLKVFRCRDSRTFCIYNISNSHTAYTVTQTLEHLVHMQNFKCQVHYSGSMLVARLTFPSHCDYVRAYNKIYHFQHVFGSECRLKH
ncbi:uncharacterized protein LOC128718066 [Anopheles marshallii]|uniref:uncharacterized protein LOC128718066 n=1 Tax=Anopheles marshallii TaxID=1521116 RepID=UPI00237B0177|nr:uncharacterized protein LOC128718066 [Anopheles marshallii]